MSWLCRQERALTGMVISLGERIGMSDLPVGKNRNEWTAWGKEQEWVNCLWERTGMNELPGGKNRNEWIACGKEQEWMNCLGERTGMSELPGQWQRCGTSRASLPPPSPGAHPTKWYGGQLLFASAKKLLPWSLKDKTVHLIYEVRFSQAEAKTRKKSRRA
jgi:hypothetical protein